MTKECKQQFTLRITQANKTEMIVILYEMILTYLSDAEAGLEKGEIAVFREALRRTRGCFGELLASLNLEYELAVRLLSLYLYCNRELTKADIHKDTVPLQNIRSVIEKLHTAYRELALMDTTGPVMQNSQTVYSGLTYGKNKLSEDMTEESLNRGFLA
jgi:flagellar protein FliS